MVAKEKNCSLYGALKKFSFSVILGALVQAPTIPPHWKARYGLNIMSTVEVGQDIYFV